MKKYTAFVLVLVFLVWIKSFFYYSSWDQNGIMAGGDCTGYYMYLPATFIQHDLIDLRATISERNKAAGIVKDSANLVKDVGEVYFYKGRPVIKYTCGVAILESPAFFLARIMAFILKQSGTGFDKIFILLVHIWNLIFAFIGLILLALALQELFGGNDKVIALTIFSIALCTNLYHFVVYNIGMSHPYLFSLYALLLFSTINFYKHYSFKYATLIGLSAGLITLVRPNEIICILIPFLYGIPQLSDLKDRFFTLLSTKSAYLAVLVFGLCATPQLLYWKFVTGHWFYYSYGEETFDFLHSRIYAGLFTFQNGWLPYTPIMIFAIAGVGCMVLKRSKTLLATLVFVPLHIYIIYSWWCYNYINGLGSRPMIETYALLSIPLAAFTETIWKSKILRGFWLGLVAFFMALQSMMTYQCSKDILWSEVSNQTFYTSTLFKLRINMNDVITFDTDEKQPQNPQFSHSIFFESFSDSSNSGFIRNACESKGFSFLLDNRSHYTPPFCQTISACKLHPLDWVKISFDNCNLCPPASLGGCAFMCAEFSNKEGVYKSADIRIQNKIQPGEDTGIWVFPCAVHGKVFFFTQVPDNAKPNDFLKVYGANGSTSPVAINNLSIEAFHP